MLILNSSLNSTKPILSEEKPTAKNGKVADNKEDKKEVKRKVMKEATNITEREEEEVEEEDMEDMEDQDTTEEMKATKAIAVKENATEKVVKEEESSGKLNSKRNSMNQSTKLFLKLHSKLLRS